MHNKLPNKWAELSFWEKLVAAIFGPPFGAAIIVLLVCLVLLLWLPFLLWTIYTHLRTYNPVNHEAEHAD